MNASDWLALLGIFIPLWVASLGSTFAYVRYERRLLETFIEAVYAKKVDMARLEEKLVSMDAKLTDIREAVVRKGSPNA